MKTVNLAATLLEVLLLAEGAQKRRPSFSESEHGVLSKKILLTILRKKQLCDVLNTMESKGLSSKPLKDDRNNANSSINRETRVKRKEILEKKKAIDEVVKAASSEKDPLSSLSPLCHYHTKGISVYLEPGRGDKLSFPVKHYIQNLLKVNMEGPYGSEWPMEEKIKRREMVVPEARYIFVYEALDACQCESSVMHAKKRTSASYLKHKEPMVGFLHYRFVVEEEVPVLYVYELQLEPRVRGKGLGKFLMQLIERIAQKNHMGAVMLTVQKANLDAMNFYTSKLGYLISTTSPSRVDPLIGLEKSYEILCKTFSNDAKALLEESG